MNFTLTTLPDVGTPIELTTRAGRRYRGRVRHLSVDVDGIETIGITEGAGWWVVPVHDIARVRALPAATAKRGRTNGLDRPSRLAFAA